YMLSRPDDWQIRVADLVRRSPDGESAVRSGLRELEHHGYLVRKQRHDAATGRFAGITLTVHEQPTPSAGASSDSPQTELPQTDDPHTGNRPHTNTEPTKTEQIPAEVDDAVPPMPPHHVSAQSTDPILAQVVALYEQEIGGTLTAMIADELNDLVQNECHDLERWRTAFRDAIGARNRWKYARAIILHPERKPPQEVHRAANQRSGQHRKANDRGRVTTPSPEEIERLNRHAEEQLRERGTSQGT
ncbi:MAG: hypothetical protein MUQ30_11945, partial [Anaerolineae bacterium]|nr:hypothetical protein [Anaerolineae bacterium]